MSEQDEKLDQLLQQWDRQHRSAEGFESLQDRISSALAEERAADSVDAPRPLPSETTTAAGRTVLFRAGMVVAALLLFAIGLWWRPWQGSPAAIPGTSGTPDFAQLAGDQLAGRAELLAEMDLLFDGQLSWVAESDGQVRMKVAESLANDASEGNGEPLAIRVVVARRDEGQPAWRQLWAVDVVSRSQHVVRLDREAEDDLQIALWAYVLPDGMIAVDSSISAQGPFQLEATSNGVQEAGKPIEVAARRVDGAEYRVFQTVALLKNEA